MQKAEQQHQLGPLAPFLKSGGRGGSGGVKYGTKGKLEPWPSFVLALELVPVVVCPGVNLRA